MRMLGRYEHNSDPQLAMLLHEVTEQGWGNDSGGDLDEDGFHASLLIVEPAERQELTESFDHDIPAGNGSSPEDQQGLVTMDSIRRRTRPGAPSTTCPTPAVLGRGRHHHPGWAARQPVRGPAGPRLRP
jgi:hypothetical protein